MPLVAAFGNPLLDITVKIPNKTLLDKYNLNPDDQKEIPPSQIKSLLADINTLNPALSPGGAAQNTLRVLQWAVEQPNSTVMFGTIGQDEQGRNLDALLQAAGVQTRYTIHETESTGIVVALISGAYRSLSAHIGAAQFFQAENLSQEDLALLKTVDLIYMEGFFLTEQRRQVAEYIQQLTQKHKKLFAFNLSAVYMAESYPEDLLYFSEKCDILYGNSKEYEGLIKYAKLPYDDAASFIKQLSMDYNNTKHLKYGKLVVMTNGANTVLCAHSSGQLEEISVPKIDASKIGDTTGAGDSFAAGFLAGVFAGQSPIGCLKWACWTAKQIIQQIGCTIPNYPAKETLAQLN